jgi:dTDP-4-amino-4,6-dideoxygalactose transaminase
MMDIQAAIGLHQLERVEENWQRRYTIWQRYTQGLAGLPIGLPPDPEPDTRHGRHLFTILIDPKRAGLERDQFLAAMHAQNIGTGVHYLSVPEHPYYQDRLGWRPEAWPESLRIGRQTVSLPLSPHLTDDDVEDVLLAVYRVLGRE